MSDTITGTVTACARSGKSIQLDDGNWYSAFNASQLDGVEKGDTVDLKFKLNGRYRNIQGNATKSSGSTGGSASSGSSTSSAGSRRSYRANGEEGGFPIHPLAYERALDRRNALAVAGNILAASVSSGKLEVITAEDVIDFAMQLEQYSTGDLDRMAMEAMTSTGTI